MPSCFSSLHYAKTLKRIEIGIFRFPGTVNFQAEIIVGISGALYQRPANLAGMREEVKAAADFEPDNLYTKRSLVMSF